MPSSCRLPTAAKERSTRSTRRSVENCAKRSSPIRSGGRSQPRWLLLPDGRAVVEAAAAIGLPLLDEDERDPLVASSRGLGELVLMALQERPQGLLVGLGGSATVDGGAGLREVLRELPTPTTVLCDVTTTLSDAARVFGPQKGATEEASRCSSDGSQAWTSFCRMPGSRVLEPRGVSALHSLLTEPSSFRVRRRSSTSSGSTSTCTTATSRSRARARSMRRRLQGRLRASSQRAARRPAFVVSSSAAVSSRRSPACRRSASRATRRAPRRLEELDEPRTSSRSREAEARPCA